MSGLLGRLGSGARRVEAIALLVAGLIMGVATLQAFGQIVARFGFQSAQDWGMEALVGGVIWAVMLAAATALREERHIRLDVIYAQLRGKRRMLSDVIAYAGVVLSMTIFTVVSVMYVIQLAQSGAKSASTLGTPDWIIALALPVGSAMVVVVSFELFLRSVIRLRSEASTDGND